MVALTADPEEEKEANQTSTQDPATGVSFKFDAVITKHTFAVVVVDENFSKYSSV